MDNCITCSFLCCSFPDRKLRTKCAASYAVFCIRGFSKLLEDLRGFPNPL
ncbi:MAG: hypothetical protein AABX07_06055 [Nanoarchaeota archaeon]